MITKWLIETKPQDLLKSLYGELPHYSEEYIDNIFLNKGNIIRNGAIYNADISSQFVNVANGLRHTVGQPLEFSNSVYLLGASTVYGAANEDAHTFASVLQKKLTESSTFRHIKVHNLGLRGGEQTPHNMYIQLNSLSLRQNDWIFVFLSGKASISIASDTQYQNMIMAIQDKAAANFCHFVVFALPYSNRVTTPSRHELFLESHSDQTLIEHGIQEEKFKKRIRKHLIIPNTFLLAASGIPFIDLQPYADRPHNLGEVFVDSTVHCNYKMQSVIANALFDIISQPLPKKLNEDTALAAAIDFLKQKTIEKYGKSQIMNWVQTISEQYAFPEDCAVIGSIVMNANPFTRGHLHLVERALEQVDALYIFLVEEDKSFFPFKDRLKLVKAGIGQQQKPVHIVPSGRYIISSFSFPGYFTKDTITYQADPSLDVLLFGSLIAPHLRICKRFVGEEPTCAVTSQYNATMQHFLPELGVEVVIIPRKTDNEMVISASTVRKLLADKDFERIQLIVPTTTYEYLMKKYSTDTAD